MRDKKQAITITNFLPLIWVLFKFCSISIKKLPVERVVATARIGGRI